MISMVSTSQSLTALPCLGKIFATSILWSISLQFTVGLSVDLHLKTRIIMKQDSRIEIHISSLGHSICCGRMMSEKFIGGKCLKTLKRALFSMVRTNHKSRGIQFGDERV